MNRSRKRVVGGELPARSLSATRRPSRGGSRGRPRPSRPGRGAARSCRSQIVPPPRVMGGAPATRSSSLPAEALRMRCPGLWRIGPGVASPLRGSAYIPSGSYAGSRYLLGVVAELEQAALAAEPVGRALVLERQRRRLGVDVHAADGVASRWPCGLRASGTGFGDAQAAEATDRGVRSSRWPTSPPPPRAGGAPRRARAPARRARGDGGPGAGPDDLRLAGGRREPRVRAAARPCPARGRSAHRLELGRRRPHPARRWNPAGHLRDLRREGIAAGRLEALPVGGPVHRLPARRGPPGHT